MKHIFLILATTLTIKAQVFNFTDTIIDCHQSIIELSVIDSGLTQGEFTLQYLDVIWQDCNLPWQVINLDTFYITFSGMGLELHSFDSLRVMYRHYPTSFTWPVLYLTNPCVTTGIEPIELNPVISVEYYNFSGQRITEPKGLYIEVIIYKNTYSRCVKSAPN